MNDNYTYISYDDSLKMFDQAEKSGKRFTMGELKTAQWLQKENINLDIIKNFSLKYSDLKIFIIGEGEYEGFYIYSKKHETCIKFGTSLSHA